MNDVKAVSLIKLIQKLNVQEKMAVLQIIQGAKMLYAGEVQNKKQRITRRSYS